MGSTGLLMQELECPNAWLDRGLVADTLTTLAPPTVDPTLEWDEPIFDPRESAGTSLLASIASLLRGRSRGN